MRMRDSAVPAPAPHEGRPARPASARPRPSRPPALSVGPAPGPGPPPAPPAAPAPAPAPAWAPARPPAPPPRPPARPVRPAGRDAPPHLAGDAADHIDSGIERDPDPNRADALQKNPARAADCSADGANDHRLGDAFAPRSSIDQI